MDRSDWSLEDHLLHGRAAIREIAAATDGSNLGPRVCFHLYPITSDDDDNWGMEAEYCQRAKRGFDECGQMFDVDYVGGLCGVEAWQYLLPTEDWLTDTLPLVWTIAEKANMSLAGWSFEPESGPYMSVSSSVNVYNGNQLREVAPPAAARSFGRLSHWLRRQLR